MILSSDLVGAILGIGSALFFAISILLVRKATVTGEPMTAVLASAWTAGLLFLPTSVIFYYPDFGLTTKSALAFAGVGVLGTIIGRFLYFTGTKKVGASRSEPITRASLLVSTIFSTIVIKESVTVGHLGGIFLILIGVIIVGHEIESRQLNQHSNWKPSLNLLLPLGAMLFFGLADPLIKIGLSEGTHTLVGLTVQYSVALILLSIYSTLKNKSPLHPFQADERKLYFGAGITTTMAMIFLFLALNFSRVVVAVPLKSTSPLLVLLLSYFYLGDLEKITDVLVIGSIFIVVGAALIGLFM